MPSREKPHHHKTNSHGIAFWKGNVAADEDTADRAVVYTGPSGMPYPTFEFKWPEQKHEVERLGAALDKAFDAGRYHAKMEIRAALGISEAR